MSSAILTFDGVNGADDINFWDKLSLSTLLDVQRGSLNGDKKIYQFNRASHFHHPQIKADLKSGQQQMRILKMAKQCGNRRVIVYRSALNHTLSNFLLYLGERMSK